jgi:ribosomal protein L11 methyltransferase
VTPDRWLVVRIPAPADPLLCEAVVGWLMEGGWSEVPPRGVHEAEGMLILHLPPPSAAPETLVEALRDGLRGLGAPASADGLTTSWQPHEDWAEIWRRGFGTRVISERIVVTPSWEPVEAGPGQVVLTLDPGMAFGTSEHPTTRGSLRLLDACVAPGSRIADVGAGSGILAMAAACLGAGEVLALELDPWAVNAARENAERNGVADRVRVVARGVGPEFLPGEAPFDGIVANIESPILRPLIPGFARGLRPGGWLILSGILEPEAPGMVTVARDAGFRLASEDREEGWWSGTFIRAGGEDAPGAEPSSAPPA